MATVSNLTAHVATGCSLNVGASRSSHVDGLGLASVGANLKLNFFVLLQAAESLAANMTLWQLSDSRAR